MINGITSAEFYTMNKKGAPGVFPGHFLCSLRFIIQYIAIGRKKCYSLFDFEEDGFKVFHDKKSL
jgi:hypothetical protein